MKRRANLALPSRITTGGFCALAQEKEKRRIPRMELGS